MEGIIQTAGVLLLRVVIPMLLGHDPDIIRFSTPVYVKRRSISTQKYNEGSDPDFRWNTQYRGLPTFGISTRKTNEEECQSKTEAAEDFQLKTQTPKATREKRFPVLKSTPDVETRFISIQKYNEGSVIDLETILSEFNGGHISFLGPAGSGKTTLLQHIARKVERKKYLKGIELVLHVNLRQFLRQTETTAEQLFFGHLPDASQVLKFAEENPHKVLFVIDSLETLRFSPDDVYEGIVLPLKENERSSPKVLLRDLLFGDLFPGSFVVTSSREDSMQNHYGEIRPHKVILLGGLDQDSIDYIIDDELGTKAADLKNYLKKDPMMSAICSNPFLLKATIPVWNTMRYKKVDYSPLSITNLLDLHLSRFIQSSKDLGSAEEVTESLLKLAELSYEGIRNSRATVFPDDLKKIGITYGRTLGILVPANSVKSKMSAVYVFVHTFYQEILSALHIARMKYGAFENTIKDEVNQLTRYAAVRRFLYGLLLGLERQESLFRKHLTKESGCQDRAKKQSLLISAAKTLLNDVSSSKDRAELFATLVEARGSIREIVQGTTPEIRLENFPLDLLDMVNLANVIKCYDKVEALLLGKSNLAAHHIRTLWALIEFGKVKITKINVDGNTDMDDGVDFLGKIARNTETEKLSMCCCHIRAEQLRGLKDSLGEKNLKFLIMDDDVEVDDLILEHVSSLLSNVEQNLSLVHWRLSPMQKLYIRWKHQQLSNTCLEITFSRHETAQRPGDPDPVELPSLDEGAITEIREKFVANKFVEELQLRHCIVKKEGLMSTLNEALKSWDSTIRKLTVSSLKGMEKLVPGIFDVFTTALCTELNLELTDVTADMLDQSKEGMCAMLVNLSDTHGLGDFHLLGKVLKRWRTRALILKGCNLSEKDLRDLYSGFTQPKRFSNSVEKFDISYNPDIGQEGYTHTGLILKGSKNVDLSLRGCDLNFSKWEALAETLEDSDTTIRRLDVSYNEVYGYFMKEIIEFASFVCVEELELGGCSLGKWEIEILCGGLEKLKVISLGLSDNPAIDDSMQLVGETIKARKVERLDLSNCMLSSSAVSSFVEGLGEAKVSFLNLSDHKRTLTAAYAECLIQVLPCVKGRLVLCFSEVVNSAEIKIKKSRPKGLDISLDTIAVKV